MTIWWSYFWPLLAAGVVIGAITGRIGFRLPKSPAADRAWRKRRTIVLLIGILLSIAAAGLWSGPMGAAGRLARQVERDARLTLDNWEMTQVTAHLHRAPLSRTLVLSGAANDLQRRELVRIIGSLSGVRDVSWSERTGLPLIAESALAIIVSFLFGLLLAYLVELRRRYNAQWNW